MSQSFLLAIRLAFPFLLDDIAVHVVARCCVLIHTTANTFYIVYLHRLHLVLHADLVHIILHVARLEKPRCTLA